MAKKPELDTLDKLEENVSRDPSFSEDDRQLIKEMLRVYRGVKGLGVLAKGLTIVLATVAAGFALWDKVIERFYS